MAEVTPPLFQDVSSVYSGDELGLPYRDLVSEGIVQSTALAVSQRAAGANLSVDVAAGACWVLGDTNVDRQPCYRCINDAVVNKGITPDPSNPRKVLVVAQVVDEGFAGTGRLWRIDAIHGTPAPSPSEPALPASALQLALIDVTANDASIVDSQITDRRVRAGVGGQIGAFRSYTPAWTSTGTAPSLGNGTLTGKYVQIGKFVWGYVLFTMGSTTGFGTGAYRISMPVAATLGPAHLAIGNAYLFDSSASAFAQTIVIPVTPTTFALRQPVTWPTGAQSEIGQLVPWTWAQSDEMHFTFAYEAA